MICASLSDFLYPEDTLENSYVRFCSLLYAPAVMLLYADNIYIHWSTRPIHAIFAAAVYTLMRIPAAS